MYSTLHAYSMFDMNVVGFAVRGVSTTYTSTCDRTWVTARRRGGAGGVSENEGRPTKKMKKKRYYCRFETHVLAEPAYWHIARQSTNENTLSYVSIRLKLVSAFFMQRTPPLPPNNEASAVSCSLRPTPQNSVCGREFDVPGAWPGLDINRLSYCCYHSCYIHCYTPKYQKEKGAHH